MYFSVGEAPTGSPNLNSLYIDTSAARLVQSFTLIINNKVAHKRKL
jgi:hypothetical protein